MTVPFVDLQAQYRSIKAEIDATDAIARVADGVSEFVARAQSSAAPA